VNICECVWVRAPGYGLPRKEARRVSPPKSITA